jgi:hypothetical protein
MAERAPQKSAVGLLLLAWAFVGTPLSWGVFETLKKAAALFR